jgi:hypothetical protein
VLAEKGQVGVNMETSAFTGEEVPALFDAVPREGPQRRADGAINQGALKVCGRWTTHWAGAERGGAVRAVA